MKIDEIITLNDGKKYYLLEEVEYENIKYFLACGYENNNLNIRNLFLFKEENGSVVIITDESLIIKISKVLKDKMLS